MIEYVTIVAPNNERVRTDTASILELDGELLVVYHSYSPGPDGSGDFGAAKIYMQRSTDLGRSWGDERQIADIDDGDLNVMSPWLCAWKDEVLLGYVRNHSKGNTSMVIHRSSDRGKTLSEPSYIWEQCNEYRLQGGASSMMRLRSDADRTGGRLLFPYQSVPEVWVPDENEYVGSYISDDGGTSWRESKNKVYLPMRGAMEPSAAELSDGTIVASLRTQLGSVFMTRSHDRGETWELAQVSGIRSPESCSCLRRISDEHDALALFYNDADYLPKHHHYGIRTPLSAARSDDGGHTWTKIGDIDSGDRMFTNLGCTFLSTGEAILTYLDGPDPEVRGGVWLGPDAPRPGGARKFGLKSAIIQPEWFSQIQ